MKALILNGARSGNGAVNTMNDAIMAELAAEGWQAESLPLRDLKLAYCTGCFECWTGADPGLCRVDDAARDVAQAMINSDLVIYLTPVTFGGYSSELKRAVDRCICLVSPFFTTIQGETHHRPRYDRYPALIGVGVLPGPDPEQERIFKALVARNALNLHAPFHAAHVVTPANAAALLQRAVQAATSQAEVIA
jgi:multimeric flavodoxin WrbA